MKTIKRRRKNRTRGGKVKSGKLKKMAMFGLAALAGYGAYKHFRSDPFQNNGFANSLVESNGNSSNTLVVSTDNGLNTLVVSNDNGLNSLVESNGNIHVPITYDDNGFPSILDYQGESLINPRIIDDSTRIYKAENDGSERIIVNRYGHFFWENLGGYHDVNGNEWKRVGVYPMFKYNAPGSDATDFVIGTKFKWDGNGFTVTKETRDGIDTTHFDKKNETTYRSNGSLPTTYTKTNNTLTLGNGAYVEYVPSRYNQMIIREIIDAPNVCLPIGTTLVPSFKGGFNVFGETPKLTQAEIEKVLGNKYVKEGEIVHDYGATETFIPAIYIENNGAFYHFEPIASFDQLTNSKIVDDSTKYRLKRVFVPSWDPVLSDIQDIVSGID